MPMNAIAVEQASVNEDGYIEVRTIQDLYNVRLDLTANYILMNDIDLTAATAKGGDYDYGGRGWNPIGSNDVYAGGEFSGIFDGNGHKITGMRIEYSSANVPSGMGRGYGHSGSQALDGKNAYARGGFIGRGGRAVAKHLTRFLYRRGFPADPVYAGRKGYRCIAKKCRLFGGKAFPKGDCPRLYLLKKFQPYVD